MSKKYFIAVFAILLIPGCINLNPETETTTASSLYKGTAGLQLSFVKNAPPSRVLENTPFNVILKIENKGAYDIGFDEEGEEDANKRGIIVITPETGYVDFIGIEQSEDVNAGLGYKSAAFKVKGRSLSDPVGDELVIYSDLKSRELGSLSNVHSSSVFATICYPYQTKLSTSVCIDSDIYNLRPGGKACEVKDLVFSNGQGAPVAVNKIEVQMVPTDNNRVKPRFLLYIQNKGNGEVVRLYGDMGSRNDYVYGRACESQIEPAQETEQLYKYFNVISIDEEQSKLSGNDLICGEEGIAILSGKEGIVRCEGYEIDAENAYLAPLSIVLDYGYTLTISKEFDIEKQLR